MIRVTHHAMHHWLTRCKKQRVEPGKHRTQRQKAEIIRAVESGRMGTKLEAKMLGLFTGNASRWSSCLSHRLNPENVIVSDEEGVAFTLVYLDHGMVLVVTAVLLKVLYRYARGVQGSKVKGLV